MIQFELTSSQEDQIKNTIDAISPISEIEWRLLKVKFNSKSFEVNESIVHFQQKASQIYFLHSGLVRSFASTIDGKEYNKTIYQAGQFFAPIASLVQKSPTHICFETLTNCVISMANYYELEELQTNHLSLERFHRKQMEWLHIWNEKSQIELATLNATDRYLLLKTRIPQIEQLIPQYKIASFLSITPIQLSRIRKELLLREKS